MLVALQEYQQAYSRALVKSQLSVAFKARGLPGCAMGEITIRHSQLGCLQGRV